MFRKLSNDVACKFSKNFQVVNIDTSHRGPEASKNVHGGPQLRTERFSIVFGLDVHRQMGVTKYINTNNGNLDPHPGFEMPKTVNSEPELAYPSATSDHWTFCGTSFFSGDWSSDRDVFSFYLFVENC